MIEPSGRNKYILKIEQKLNKLQPKELMSGIEDNAQAHEKAQKIEISNIDLKLPLFFQIVK